MEWENNSLISKLIKFCLEWKIIIILFLILVILWGVAVAPFDWDIKWLPRNPVPVDAIPDIGENQQIVFTKWPGHSPQDVEDQITYPLTISLLGIPGVKTIRSSSMFGFSSIYVIFKEDVDFYWSRSRILEKLNSLPKGTLPEGVQPVLGPDATALGQVFWYTLEGRDIKTGKPTGGWNLDELRTIQDWYVRYALMSVDGVSEMASVGGFVKEYQVDVDPDALKAYGVSLLDVYKAVKKSNIDVGAGTIEVNKIEYVVRGLGLLKGIKDLEDTVVAVRDNVPVRIKDVAHVSLGPAPRRGALDKEGAEVVGGVVVVRYGENPLTVIKRVKEKINEIAPGLPKKLLPDGTISQVRIVPFYDRTKLIREILGTLNRALYEEVLVTIIVVVFTVMHLRSSVLISGLLPLAILMCFIAMKLFHVDANLVSLAGIAIAIGTMVDMGIVMCENILNKMDTSPPDRSTKQIVFEASTEVGGAVLTAVATTVVSFLPVFTMKGAEGKLFKPLAFTKSFALIASIIISITLIPPFAHMLFTKKQQTQTKGRVKAFIQRWSSILLNIAILFLVMSLLTTDWLPLRPENGILKSFLFVGCIILGLLNIFYLFRLSYRRILRFSLNHKFTFLSIPIFFIFFGFLVWQGFDKFFFWLPKSVSNTRFVSHLSHKFPGLGKEFMPPLDEGSFLYMPSVMPHASVGEVLDILKKQDLVISKIPEVDSVVGKLGRVESPLDPAPVSMIETIINYKPEYLVDKNGRRLRFKFLPDEIDFYRDKEGNPVPAPDGKPYKVRGKFVRDKNGKLIPDPDGMPFRLWRPPLDPKLNPGRKAWPGIERPDDIWKMVVENATSVSGATSAPKLQPIQTRIIMLQTGMRANMGIKVMGPDLKTIEKVAIKLERLLKKVPSVEPATVVADRIIGKPYLEIKPNRDKIARYGISMKDIQDMIEIGIGGKVATITVEGRERYGVRVRYMRELRDSIEAISKILIPTPDEKEIPLQELAEISYVRGPQVIKSEDGFLTGYVTFDKKKGFAEVGVIEQIKDFLQRKIEKGEFELPPGVSLKFAGAYESQIRAQRTLSIVLPLSLFIIFVIIYLKFRSAITTFLIFSGIFLAWSGGFITLWLYSQLWFLNFSIAGVSMRELFSVHPINLSVAIWVGFLALFGIASDDGVIICTYLDEVFKKKEIKSIQEIRDAVIEGALRRIRPALMTSATTILALLPVLTSTGRGSDIMLPMAIPSFGGMLFALINIQLVPVLYCLKEEIKYKQQQSFLST